MGKYLIIKNANFANNAVTQVEFPQDVIYWSDFTKGVVVAGESEFSTIGVGNRFRAYIQVQQGDVIDFITIDDSLLSSITGYAFKVFPTKETAIKGLTVDALETVYPSSGYSKDSMQSSYTIENSGYLMIASVRTDSGIITQEDYNNIVNSISIEVIIIE